MKKFNKLVAIMLVFALTALSPSSAFAEGTADITSEEIQSSDTSEVADADEIGEAESDEALESQGKGKQKPWKSERETLKLEKANMEILKAGIETQIEELESQLEAAEANGDAVAVADLKEQIESLKTEKDGYKAQMKQKIEEMKQIMRNKYTVEELNQLSLVAQTLEAVEGVETLPVENIFVKGKDVKFDTPPVIKQGRTLIPVRAIAESTGAIVEWDGETKTVTITKDNKVIVFKLLENKVFINGTEATIDVPANVMNNRTMVPIRFVAENFGLDVEWDGESQTIEIADATTQPEPVTEQTTTEPTTESITDTVAQ